MTGTYQRHKTKGNGLLNQLEGRLTDKQFERRTQKMVTRVGREHAITRGAVVSLASVLRRGFFGRLKWFVLGR